MAKVNELIREMKSHANPARAKVMQRFFKTGKGEYGEGDKFLGLSLPMQRSIARKYTELKLEDIQKLLLSPLHELRLTSLLILSRKFHKAEENEKQRIAKFYLKNAKRVNNWDLVDCSAAGILGRHLENKPRDILFKLAKSKNIWERRISMIATYALIKNNDFETTLKLSKILLTDKHDLIHKAVGWMLKEIGNRNIKVLENFLDKYCLKLPRTTLRYAIEKMDEKKRKDYLQRR